MAKYEDVEAWIWRIPGSGGRVCVWTGGRLLISIDFQLCRGSVPLTLALLIYFSPF